MLFRVKPHILEALINHGLKYKYATKAKAKGAYLLKGYRVSPEGVFVEDAQGLRRLSLDLAALQIESPGGPIKEFAALEDEVLELLQPRLVS